MKYPQRKEELPYLTRIYKELGLHMIPFPGDEPFEGQAELKWFHGGTKAVCGYGHRSTKKSFQIAKKMFDELYTKNHLSPPELLVLLLASDQYYHLDVAMLEFSDTDCIVHKRAFSNKSIAKLKAFLGAEHVQVIDTEDSFCLNAVVDGPYLITHQLEPSLKKELEQRTGKTIRMADTSEFERSGGSVRCMTLDILS
jgi:N-dimethylarginine dimethylaminohydrolase